MLEDDVKHLKHSTPIVVFPHSTLVVYRRGGEPRQRPGVAYLKKFGSYVLNGHIHQTMQKVEGNVTFTPCFTAFPQPQPGKRISGPNEVPAEQLRSVLESRRKLRARTTRAGVIHRSREQDVAKLKSIPTKKGEKA